MQNIPSHAADIRHMFRATAPRDEIYDCIYTEESDTITVDADWINHVTVLEKGDIPISELKIGDKVLLLEDGKEVYRSVKEISVANKDSRLCHVVF